MNQAKSRRGDESPYDKKYSMHHHRGNTGDHKRWKREGSSFFKAQALLMVLGLILSDSLDVSQIIENWPTRPKDWKPTIIGEESEDDDHATALVTPEGTSEERSDGDSPVTTPKTADKTKPEQFILTDVLYKDSRRVVPIEITVEDLINANDKLYLFMSATAPSLLPESIAVGTPSDEITAYFVLARLNDKLGKVNSVTESYSLIGQSLTMRFQCGEESATEYLRRMKAKLAPLKTKPKLRAHVDAIIPWVFLNNINKPKYQPYDHMAETVLLDQSIEEKVDDGYNVFERYIEQMETTLKCQSKARSFNKERWNKRSSDAQRPNNRRANGAKKKTKEAAANGAHQRSTADCKNCMNDAELLKNHKQKAHTTRECPFPPSKETMKFFQQKATVIPTGKFADRFAAAAGARRESSPTRGGNISSDDESDQQ